MFSILAALIFLMRAKQLRSGFRLISEPKCLFPDVGKFCVIYYVRDDLPHHAEHAVSYDHFIGQLGKTGTLSISHVDVSKSYSLHCGNPECIERSQDGIPERNDETTGTASLQLASAYEH